MYFKYSAKELDYLKAKDDILKQVINRIGLIKREVEPNLFVALVSSIISQQISSKAYKTIWGRITKQFRQITAESILNSSPEEIQSFGTSFRKANYIYDLALAVSKNHLDLEKIAKLSDEEIIKELTKLKGIGEWTAEMLLIFSLQRPDVLSYKDLAIIRGIKKVYNLEELPKDEFLKIKTRLSPYNSIASLYFWEVSSEK